MNKKMAYVFALLACMSGAATATAMCTPPDDPPGPLVTDTCVLESDAETGWRYLATNDADMACPSATGWTGGKLFGPGPVPPGLRKYCRYEADSEASSVTALTALLCNGGSPPANCLAELVADLLAVTSLTAQVVEGLLVDDFHGQFQSKAGATGPLPAAPQTVRLAVVDTEPSGLDEDRNGPGIAGHGFALLNLMRGMVCPDAGNCGLEIKSQLGLPLELCSTAPGASCPCSSVPETGVCMNPSAGGYVGTHSDLARAIRDEVRDWENGGASRLVINLSVGWEPRFGGTPPLVNANLTSRAVAAAIEDAVCRGALVIAAAGNRVPGPEAFTGPLFPAGWETEPAPDAFQCLALLGQAPDSTLFPVPAGAYRPLVYAAAAIDHAGAEVETRPAGEPRLAAFGDHAVTLADIGGFAEPTSTLTGSSVAAAVVSAAAAAAWYQRPARPSYEIMQAIYDAAGDTGRVADFCLGGGCAAMPVRPVKACDAVNAVCAAFPGPACAAYSCPRDEPVLAPVPTDTLLTAFAADPVTDVSTLTSSAAVPLCGPGYTLHWSAGGPMPSTPCPHRQFYGIQATPWTDSQPSGQACELCVNNYSSPGNLFIEVKDDFGDTLQDLTLICGSDAYRLPGSLQPGDRRLVSEIPEGCEFQDVAVAFRFTRNGVDGASVVSAALITADRDDDGVQDAVDNCYEVANPAQIDADGDGIGNICDADYDGNCIVNPLDLGIFKSQFFLANPIVDLNGDGIVNTVDLGFFKLLFFQIPGPSGLPNACSS